MLVVHVCFSRYKYIYSSFLLWVCIFHWMSCCLITKYHSSFLLWARIFHRMSCCLIIKYHSSFLLWIRIFHWMSWCLIIKYNISHIEYRKMPTNRSIYGVIYKTRKKNKCVYLQSKDSSGGHITWKIDPEKPWKTDQPSSAAPSHKYSTLKD